MSSRRCRIPVGLLVLVSVGSLLIPALAGAALPRTYQAQKVDSPSPTIGGNFGIAMVNTGDVNSDGKNDILVGTDEHGGEEGRVFVMSGATGAPIRTIDAPDTGGSGTLESFGSFVGRLSDIGSCAAAAGGECDGTAIGAPDGVPDMLVAALGVDVAYGGGTLVDAGRAYVVDGATGAVLRRLQMPDADLAEQAAAPGGAKKPAFGRTILNPSSEFGPTATDNSGPTTPPAGVRMGDVSGDGTPDIIVGASDYFERGDTAQPDSDCASNAANQCLQAGRGYVFYGETIKATAAEIDNAPDLVIKNLAAQADDLTSPVNFNRESMGYSVAPVGDLGRCTLNPGPGAFCPNASSSGTPDGKPDIALSSHRSDDFGMYDAGVVHLIDGSTGAVLYDYRHPEPQPAALFGFSNYNQPAVGDLGQSVAPDLYQAAMRQNNPYTGGGKGYGMNGAYKQGGSPNSISFATVVDPTPHPSEDFGTSSAGVGNLVGSDDGLDGRNEVLVGAYGPHNPGTFNHFVNDVHIFSMLSEQPLQTINAPDQKQGSGFGNALAPMGDLNDDGFMDFAVGAGLFDGSTGADQGRIYILRSDDSPGPEPEPEPEPEPGPQGPAGQTGGQGAAGAPGAAARTLTGRALELAASRTRVKRGRRVTLRGVLEAFADAPACVGGQSVALQRRGKGARYATFARVTTNAAGRFSRRIRPRSTRSYRARVNQSADCLGAVSPRERVTVRRRSSAR